MGKKISYYDNFSKSKFLKRLKNLEKNPLGGYESKNQNSKRKEKQG